MESCYVGMLLLTGVCLICIVVGLYEKKQK
jgi:hypothetical protein